MKTEGVRRLVSLLLLAGCMTVSPAFAQQTAGGGKVRVVLYIPGGLGDNAYLDSAHRGMVKAAEELDVIACTIEGGYHEPNWRPDILLLAQGGWDVIVAATWDLAGYVREIAPDHPEKVFITCEAPLESGGRNPDNVYSILFVQNEGAFLAGALAAMVTTSDMPKANPEKVIGFLGGRNIPVINDFKAGYIQGAGYIDPEVEVVVSYAGTFADPAAGREMALEQYARGVDIAFNAAGETGLGLLEAAAEVDRYAIGVDSDQYSLLEDSEPKTAAGIVTSMMKNVDRALYRAIEMYLAGTLPLGEVEMLGLAEGGVGIAYNENYHKLVPRELHIRILDLEDRILSGLITVDTAMDR